MRFSNRIFRSRLASAPMTLLLLMMMALPCLVRAEAAQGAPRPLAAAIEAAWQRSPQARTLEARRAERQAGLEAAQSWIAGSPALGLEQRRGVDGNGLQETEISVSTPVWLPGQRSARESLADAESAALEAQLVQARLTLAGEVRERVWAVAAAQTSLLDAQARHKTLEALAAEVTRRVKAGDVARTDAMLAQQQVLAAQSEAAVAEAALQEARLRFHALTGLSEIDTPQPEPLAVRAVDINAVHPRLRAAQAALALAQAEVHATRRIRSEPPTVGIAMRRERAGGTAGVSEPAERSVGVSLQIPFGTAGRNRPLDTAAQTRLATARAELAQAEATLTTDVQLADVQLHTARAALQAATTRKQLAAEHLALITKAFRLGERGLADWLRAQALLHEADTAERQQHVALGLAHARWNQILGVLP